MSSDDGENIVGDKIPESTEKFDGEFGTWQSGESVFSIAVFVSVLLKKQLLSDAVDRDECSGSCRELSKFVGDTISSGSKSRSKSNGDEGGNELSGDGGER